jgi:cell wall-associated NlpC family hydrolase
MTSAEIRVKTARDLIGAKWRHRGRKPWAVDCVGLIILACRASGSTINDRLDYGRYPHEEGLKRELLAHFGEPVSDMQNGDIVLMRWKKGEEPSHVGIIADNKDGTLNIIHAYSMIAVTEHRIDDVWIDRIVEVYRP